VKQWNQFKTFVSLRYMFRVVMSIMISA